MPTAPQDDRERIVARGVAETAVARAIRAAVVASLTYVVLASIIILFTTRYGFRHFGTESLAARAVGLHLVAWAASGATLVSAMHVTALQHVGWERVRRGRLAVGAACAVPILYLPISALAFASAIVAARIAGLDVASAEFITILEAGDLLRGMILSALLGIVVACWSLWGTKLTRSSSWGLAAKLVGTWLAMGAVSYVADGISSAAYAVSHTAADDLPGLRDGFDPSATTDAGADDGHGGDAPCGGSVAP
jgi:hypothetical protein